MKTIYSLNEFYEKALTIAAKKGVDYVSVEAKTDTFRGISFRCYAHKFDSYEGDTMEIALEKMHRAICPEDFPKQNIDVEIEMPSPEPEKDEPSATDIAGVAIILT